MVKTIESRSQINEWFSSDEQFNNLYSPETRLLAKRHWTPLSIVRKAAQFLAAEKHVKILDIGSGVGKFCLAAAHFMPLAKYYGIEQRKNLVEEAEEIRKGLYMDNVRFSHGNFTQLNFDHYDNFYFFNSFYENLSGTEKIDNSIVYSGELYNYYNRYMYKQLEQVKDGTRLATYHSLEDEIPNCFHVVGTAADNQLKFWVKA